MEKNKISIFHFEEDDSSSYEDQKKAEKKNITTNNHQNDNKSFNSSDSNNSAEDKIKSDNKKVIEEIEQYNENKINDNNINNNDGNIINEDESSNIQRTKTPNTIEKELLESIAKRENVTKENLNLAESINFKNKPDKIIDMDEFGFIKNKTQNDAQLETDMKMTKEDILTVNARTEKWRQMINNFEEYRTKKLRKLKKRTRKGIPDSVRSYVWQLFGEIEHFKVKDLYEKLQKEAIDEDTEITIIKDLDRTLPACQLFKDKYGKGQRSLFKVLSAYSKYNKEIGYVQGMAYLVALFLIYMDEESAFYLLHSIVKKYGLERIFLPGFPDLKKKFYVLLNLEKKFIPKIYDILKRDGVMPSIYASEWFICLFSKDLKPNILVRIFDTFLLEGYKVIYRFSLAFLKMQEKEFIKSKPGIVNTMEVLKKCLDNIDINELFKVAFDFHLSKKHIEKFEQEYENNKNEKNNEFIQQL